VFNSKLQQSLAVTWEIACSSKRSFRVDIYSNWILARLQTGW